MVALPVSAVNGLLAYGLIITGIRLVLEQSGSLDC